MKTVFETESKRLLALYSMGQELPAYGVDHVAAWRRHLSVLDTYASYTFEPDRPYDVVGWSPSTTPRIYVHFHLDARFADGPAAISRVTSSVHPERHLRVIVAGDSHDQKYAGFGLAYADGGSGLNLETLGVDEKNFTARLVQALRSGDDACVTIDANAGSTDQHLAPFLRHEIKIREAVFLLARGLRMVVEPIVVDSATGQVFCGPELSVRDLGVKGTIDRSVHFLSQHVARRPEHWLHWGALMPLSSQTTTISTPAVEVEADAPSWVVAPHVDRAGTYLALDVETSRLYELGREEYAAHFSGMDAWVLDGCPA